MLTTEQRAIVKSTVPLLETSGEALTTYFYQHLLRDYPEVRVLFNQTHQASGDQPRALANAVLRYARHIDNLAPLGAMVGRIINKHVALQILPEHYPLVGAGLLRAIRDVLGAELATDAVIDAWAAAYGQLSQLLIGAETEIYDAKANAPGGWRGERAFTVAQKVVESDEIVSFYLRPADGGALLAFEPGQFIGLRLRVAGEDVRRNYSLSQQANGIDYRISVKREAHGKVSGFLHDQVHVGDSLSLFVPSGDFTLLGGVKPLVLISGGVGITPTLAMLQAALKTERPVVFIHAARHAGVQAFRTDLDALARAHPQLTVHYSYSERRTENVAEQSDAHAHGSLTPALLEACLPQNRDVDAYYLGPLGFMRMVRQALLAIGVPAEQMHHEFFGPAKAME